MKITFTEMLILIILIITALNSYFLIRSGNKDNNIGNIVIDTIYKERVIEPIVAKKISARRIKSSQVDSSFRAVADTVINKDTISISYAYPEDYFDFEMRHAPDSLMQRVITINRDIVIPEPWWENPLYFAVGLIAGLISYIIII
ncbi:hypothetical protein MASR1M45_04590 [Candidatus Kapaibacterium sp.]